MSEAKPLRAVLYTRVSTEAQETNSSLAAQFAACAKKAADVGAEVVCHEEEIVSGGLYLARPGIQRALALIEAKEADLLIVAKLDRAGRDVGDLRDIRARIERAGAQLLFADGMQFERTPVGNLMFTQIGAFAEFEREIIRERLQGGARKMLATGRAVSRSLSPIGYHIVKKSDVLRGLYPAEQLGLHIIVEEEAKSVRLLFDLYDGGLSIRALCLELDRRGVPTQTKNHAAPLNRTGWGHAAMHYILRNPVYIGRPQHGKSTHGVDQTRTERGLGARYVRHGHRSENHAELSAPPLIEAGQWNRVQKRLDEAQKSRAGRTDRRYLLAGLLKCPLCGASMQGTTSSASYVVKSGERRLSRTLRYRCRHNMPINNNGSWHEHCLCKPYAAERLNRMVLEAVVDFASDPTRLQVAYREYLRAQAIRERAARTKRTPGQKQSWKRELGELEKREAAAAAAKVEAMIKGQSTGAFDRMLEEAAARRAQLEEFLHEPEPSYQPARAAEIGAALSEQAARIRDVLLAGEEVVSDAEKNELLRTVVLRVDICDDPQSIILTLRGERDDEHVKLTNAGGFFRVNVEKI